MYISKFKARLINLVFVKMISNIQKYWSGLSSHMTDYVVNRNDKYKNV